MTSVVNNPRVGHMSDVSSFSEWKSCVVSRDGGLCVNCESTELVSACLVVPYEVGGKLRTSNGVTLCRECRKSLYSSRVSTGRIDNKTSINFLISNRLHKDIVNFTRDSKFGNVSSLLRAMIDSFISDPDAYEDISSWQDHGSEVKINVWVDGSKYNKFRNICKDRGISYTDALKALLLVAIDNK